MHYWQRSKFIGAFVGLGMLLSGCVGGADVGGAGGNE